jgi:hypothetical protein
MIFTLRQQAARLGLRFQDADLTLNKLLIEDERRMFLHPEAENYRSIGDVVGKTKEEDARYRSSRIDGHEAKFVPPFTFIVSPTTGHPRQDELDRSNRLICLYDNAGEHFRPGADASDKPMTRHLAASRGLMYVFDPTRDRRFREKLNKTIRAPIAVDRQDVILIEAANRIREHGGIAQTSRLPQTLVVVLTKFDVWRSLLPEGASRKFLHPYPGSMIDALYWDDVYSVSAACRDLLCWVCPEIVNSAESVSENVIYTPVAALGWDVMIDPSTNQPAFRASNCQPSGVLVPILAILANSISKVVVSLKDPSRDPSFIHGGAGRQ